MQRRLAFPPARGGKSDRAGQNEGLFASAGGLSFALSNRVFVRRGVFSVGRAFVWLALRYYGDRRSDVWRSDVRGTGFLLGGAIFGGVAIGGTIFGGAVFGGAAIGGPLFLYGGAGFCAFLKRTEKRFRPEARGGVLLRER